MCALCSHALWRQIVEHDLWWTGGTGSPPLSKCSPESLWAAECSYVPCTRLHQIRSSHFPRADRLCGQQVFLSGVVQFSAAVFGSPQSQAGQTHLSRDRNPSSGLLWRWLPFLGSILLPEHLPKLQWPPNWWRTGAASLGQWRRAPTLYRCPGGRPLSPVLWCPPSCGGFSTRTDISWWASASTEGRLKSLETQ